MKPRFVEASLRVQRQHAALAESLMLSQGALAVTLTDSHDTPVWEPPVGETPLWDEVVLTGLYPVHTDSSQLLAALSLLPATEPAALETVEEQVWERVWMDRFKPMRFGDNLWIVPTGSEPPDPEGVLLHLDPGLAFGTGTHPTTRLCLEWIDAMDLQGKQVLDFGCGSGVLGIAAALSGAATVHCVDYDPQAVWATDQNAERNGVADQVIALQGDQPAGPAVEVVIANILAGILIRLAEPLVAVVAPEGCLVLTGILEEQAGDVGAAYAAAGLPLQVTARHEGWVRMEGAR